MHRTGLNGAVQAHLHEECIEPYDRVAAIQPATLPLRDLFLHCVGHPRDQGWRDLGAIQLRELGLDVARAEPPAVEGHDLLIQSVHPCHMLRHDLRLESRLPVAWYSDFL